MDKLLGFLCLVGATALCACGSADASENEEQPGNEMASSAFRTDDGVNNPGGRPSGGGWISNGLEDPDVSGVDPAFSLNSSAGLSPSTGLLTDPDLIGTAEYLVECALPF